MPKIIITGLLIAFTLIGYSQKKMDITIADLDAVAKNLLNETKGNNADGALAYYKKLKLTNEYYLEEEEINRYGYSLLFSQQPEAALKIFNLYVAEFPNSPNGYDSRGEVYYNQKNYAASRKDYEKSLQLNPKNQNAKEMILKIKGL